MTNSIPNIYLRFLVLFYGFSFCFKSQELLPSNPHRESEYKTGLFSSIQGYAIRLVFKSLRVSNALGCVSACLRYTSCQSINLDTAREPTHLCELSETTFDSKPFCKTHRPGFIHYFLLQTTPVYPDEPCNNVTCKNGATCEPVCNGLGYRCKCRAFNEGQHCQLWTVNISSCNDILNKTTYREDMAYTYMIDNKQTDIYCQLSSDICGSRGWTLVMKTDGSKGTFYYSSTLWSNKNAYELSAGKTGFDSHETKMPSYWAMPFQSLCVGMKAGSDLNWALIPYTASSLYDVIADEAKRSFAIGRSKWVSLISGSSLQEKCNNESFNNLGSARIGISGDDADSCSSPNSMIGFGLPLMILSCGNVCPPSCSGGGKNIVTFGYILIK